MKEGLLKGEKSGWVLLKPLGLLQVKAGTDMTFKINTRGLFQE